MFFSIFLLFYAWAGYFVTIKILSLFRKKTSSSAPGYDHTVTIIIAVHNEEKNIVARINNLALQTYDRIVEIIVALDGSTDSSLDLVHSMNYEKLAVIISQENVGRALMHNLAVEKAKGEILIFTDAETEFDKGYVSETVKQFNNDRIGCVVGTLKYNLRKPSSVAQGESIYWKYELAIRRAEERIGVLANATGAAMAIRKILYKKLRANEDVDTATPIDIALAGKYVSYAENAIAYDFPPATIQGEFASRIRGVAQTINCIMKRVTVRDIFRSPMIYFGLFWHRICRYLTFPLLLIVLSCSIAVVTSGTGNRLTFFILILQMIFYILAALGGLNFLRNRESKTVDFPFNFIASTLAMSIGFYKGVSGQSPSIYKHHE